jgi:hypothetical protein
MKPRARRVTLAAAVLGAGVVAVLVVSHWRAVRDHVEAWHFQLTRETQTMNPDAMTVLPHMEKAPKIEDRHRLEVGDVLHLLKVDSGYPVVYDPVELVASWYLPDGIERPSPRRSFRSGDTYKAADVVMRILRGNGWSVLEQRFPRRAYVVIRDKQ